MFHFDHCKVCACHMSVLFNCFICSSIDVNNGNNMERNGTVLRANDISEQFGQYCDKLCVIGPIIERLSHGCVCSADRIFNVRAPVLWSNSRFHHAHRQQLQPGCVH